MRNESITETVVWAVAEAKGVDPLDLDAPLYDSVDPDALQRILDAESFEGQIGFSLAGCDVTVHHDGRVVVAGGAEAAASEPSASPVSQG
ncbi:HalOD1 output domain-containing protein [Halostella litorea]|uniref:HalOD1 output domain-containing protein n=1 Tax=Halostella litorea TaxID=2528831 RepID=UPI001092BFAE|nr:HalOD1 output domain-containing protein [Halostella litorea]